MSCLDWETLIWYETMKEHLLSLLLVLGFAFAWEVYNPSEAQLDLQDASIVIPSNPSDPLLKATQMLVDEVYKRTVVQLPVNTDCSLESNNGFPIIYISSNQLPNLKVLSHQ